VTSKGLSHNVKRMFLSKDNVVHNATSLRKILSAELKEFLTNKTVTNLSKMGQ